MNPSGSPDDPALNELLLSKADALIRRNRPDGVGTEVEELPLLTDLIDDLPELTDAIDIAENDFTMSAWPGDDETITVSLEDVDGAVEDARPALLSQADIAAAVERTRAELQAIHERDLAELSERLRAEAATEQAHAVESATTTARRDAQNAAESTQQTLVQEARRDAWQTAAMAMSEHLIELDAYIAQSIDQWMTRELPQILNTELANMTERIRGRASSHLRATLLPQLSDRLSEILDKAQAEGRSE